MILSALNDYYYRLLDQKVEDVSPYGYSLEKISYVIVLSVDGEVMDVMDIRNDSGKKILPGILMVPQPPKRASNITPCFLWDKTSYVLGVSAVSKRADKEHEAFQSLHREVLCNTDDIGLLALRRFLEDWRPEQFHLPPFNSDMCDSNVAFRLDGEMMYLHERAAAQKLRARLLECNESAPIATCLITGEQLPVARLHPNIKGVNGAQGAGASIVSFNLESFASYGKIQGDNAPISEQAAFAYTTVLNYLLRRDEHNRQRLQIGDTTVVFWAQAPTSMQSQAAEDLFSLFFNTPADDGQESSELRSVLAAISEGRPLRELGLNLQDDTRIFVLGLAPNNSRLYIRFWQADRLDVFAYRLARHFEDLHIEPLPWRQEPSLGLLLLQTAPVRGDKPPKSEDVPPRLAGELARAIFTGSRYPRSLLNIIIMRIRADGHIYALRVALCKAVLAREKRLFHKLKEVPVSLDTTNKDPGYLLGRLFATLENIQVKALGNQVNATIRDRYYGAASATPAAVFPVLLRNAQNHLSRVRKDQRGLAINLEKDLGGIIDLLQSRFPRSMGIESQGHFAIGYYHQTQSQFNRMRDGVDSQGASIENNELSEEGESV